MKFKVHTEDIALDAETIIDLQRFEVQSVGAVVLTGNRPLCALSGQRKQLKNLHVSIFFFCIFVG